MELLINYIGKLLNTENKSLLTAVFRNRILKYGLTLLSTYYV